MKIYTRNNLILATKSDLATEVTLSAQADIDKVKNATSPMFYVEGEVLDAEEYRQHCLATKRASMSTSMVKFRAGLIKHGVAIATIEAAIKQAITDPTQQALALNDWEYSSTVSRLNPLVVSLAPVFNLTPEQLDGIFAQ